MMDIKRIYRILVLCGITILSFFLLIPSASIPKEQTKGKISKITYVAPFDFSVIDREKQEQMIKDKQSKVCSVYFLDLETSLKLLEDVTKVFLKVADIRENNKISQKKKEEKIKKLFDCILSEDARLMASADKNIFIELEEVTKNIMNTCLEKGILNDSIQDKGIEIIKSKKETGTITPIENVLTIMKIKNSNLKGLKLFQKQPTNIDELSFKIASSYLSPNLYLDKKMTKKRLGEKGKIEPVKIFVKKGDIIVSEGEIIDSLAEGKLITIARREKGINKETFLSFFVIFLLCLAFLIVFILKYQRDLKEEKILAISLISLFAIAFAKCLVLWMPNFWMCLPMPSISILTALFSSPIFAIFFTFILGILILFIFGLDFNVFLFFIGGGISSIFFLSIARKRADLIKVCFCIALVNILCAIFLSQEPLRLKLTLPLLNSIIVYFVTIGSLPIFETFFPTNFKFFELSDLNIPILRDLFFEAPGTYHHSLIVGTLAEDAASSIGANSILARTGSYYHDIGKIINPEYFVENQKERKTEPSPAILKSHIERGVSIAKIKHLPLEIIDIIKSHHGTSKIEEEKYPGPLPSTKEEAIVMLASCVEEKIRTFEKPSSDMINSVVKDTMDEKIFSSELSTSTLTMNELKKIEESFINILTTLFHAKDEAKSIG